MADPGLEVLEHVRAAFEPDARWCEETVRGFTWWPAAFAQRFHADDVRETGGVRTWRVRAELPLLAGVAGTGEHFATLSRWNAAHPGLSALRWNGDDGAVSWTSTVLVSDGDWERGARGLAIAGLLQLADATRDAAMLARELAGEPAPAAPPGGTPRTEPDALVEAWRRFAEAGAAPGPFTPARLQQLGATQPPPWLRVNVDAAGLHAEMACALAGEARPGSAPGAGVALFHVLTSQPHPALGAGALAALVLPAAAEPLAERHAATAALLNEAEAREFTGCDGLGAWCVHPAAGLAWVTFVPALLDAEDVLERLAWSGARRARWARHFLAKVGEMRAPGRHA